MRGSGLSQLKIGVVVTVALAFCLAGCSDEEPAASDTTPEETSSETTPEPTSGETSPAPTADEAPSTAPSGDEDVAAIQQLYADYWEALIASENGPDPDPALFDGIAAGGILEAQVARVQNMVDEEQRRVGQPIIGEAQVSVDGDQARAEACVDQQPWGVVVQEQTQPPLDIEPDPIGVVLEREGTSWIIVDRIPIANATISC